MGKGARRALLKNADCVEEFMDLLLKAEKAGGPATVSGQLADTRLARDTLAYNQENSHIYLARVERSTGAGRLEVVLQNGERMSVAIAGTLKFKGKSATKTDRANCMCAKDIIVVRGGLASGKISTAIAEKVGKRFERLGVTVPVGFFGERGEGGEEDGWEFDRSDEMAEEEREIEALRAAGGGGGAVISADVDVDNL